MVTFQTLPLLWLLSDARNDAVLEDSLKALPGGSGFVFRHYHLDKVQRRARFRQLAALARSLGHCVIISGSAVLAASWGSDGFYGPADRGAERTLEQLWLATAHDAEEIAAADGAGADGIFLSPVFATRSHKQAQTLGLAGFHILAQQSRIPVIALGGMTHARAADLGWSRWAAIDGLSRPANFVSMDS